jgi:hypothetical protein
VLNHSGLEDTSWMVTSIPDSAVEKQKGPGSAACSMRFKALTGRSARWKRG